MSLPGLEKTDTVCGARFFCDDYVPIFRKK